MSELKSGLKFFAAARSLLKNNGTVEEVKQLAEEYDVTKERVDEWLKKTTRSSAVSGALMAGKEEKDHIFNTLDQKFTEAYPNIVVFRRGENTTFYEYKDGVYIQLATQDMYNYLDDFMVALYLLEHRTSTRKVKDTIERVSSLLARTLKRHFTEEDIIHRKWYLNLKNGLLDMETYELKSHTPDYFSTVQVPYEYDPQATAPEFETFVATVSGGKPSNATMLQQMYGYSIMEGNPSHKVFYLFGDTARNGKSTAAKILCGLIGWGNVSTLSLQQIASENSHILTSIIGKQINFSDEISSKFVESSRLTAMSAEGIVEINPKNKSPFLYPIRAKFIIACNDLPRFSDFQGMKHRMINIPFPYHLKESERVERYDEVLLKKEGSGILNWAIEGAKKLKECKHVFEVSEDSQEGIIDNVMQSYPVYAYLDEMYAFNDDYKEHFDPDVLYGGSRDKDIDATGYRLFCDRKGIKCCSAFTFARELKRFGRETGKIRQIRVREEIGQPRVYIGMRLKTDAFREDIIAFNKM